jgi:hypothetical protein
MTLPSLPWKAILCANVAAQLFAAALISAYRGEWRDAVVLMAGAAVNGVMAV